MQRLTANQVPNVLKQLVDKQNGKCAVCGHPFTQRDGAVLDHDHTTGFIRGALHRSCNGAEGKVKYKAKLCHTGITAEKYIIGLGKYLEEHAKPKYPLLHPTHLTADEKRLERNRKARLSRARKKK
jgi:hypothetical protein